MRTQWGRSRVYKTVSIAAILVCVTAAGRSAVKDVEVGNSVCWDLAERFKVTCDTVQLSAKVEGSGSGPVERALVVTAKLDISESKDLVGLDVREPVILELRDGGGNNIQYLARQVADIRQYQEVKHVRATEGPRTFDRLEPSQMSVRVTIPHDMPFPSSVSSLKWYVYALFAEDVIAADVLFEVGKSVEAPPDLHIYVEPTTPSPPGPIEFERFTPPGFPVPQYRPKSPVALYQYYTRVKSKTGKPVMGLERPWYSGPGGYTLGDCVVVRTELVDSKSKVILKLSNQHVGNDPFGRDGAPCWGEASQDTSDYNTIRHIIAVRPRELKIPFELEDVPVPALEPSDN